LLVLQFPFASLIFAGIRSCQSLAREAKNEPGRRMEGGRAVSPRNQIERLSKGNARAPG